MNSAQFLRTVMSKHGLTSHYQAAKFLGISQSRISMYRTGKREFDDETCVKIANALGEGPLYVMGSIHAQRAKCTQVRDVWRYCAKIGKRGKVAVIALLLALGMAGFTPQPTAAGGQEYTLYAQGRGKGRKRSWLERALNWTDRTFEAAIYPLCVSISVAAILSLAACTTADGGPKRPLRAPAESVEIIEGHSVPMIRVNKICAGNRQSHRYRRCKGLE